MCRLGSIVTLVVMSLLLALPGAIGAAPLEQEWPEMALGEAGEYWAVQDEDSLAVLLFARGTTPTSGYEVFLRESPLTVWPPEFLLIEIAPSPSTVVAQVETPFGTWAWFESGESIDTLTVHDRNGTHEIEVIPVTRYVP